MSKIKDNMIKLKLSPKREYLKIIGICLGLIGAGFAASFLIKSWLYLGIALGFSAILTVYLLSSYGSQLDKINKENTEEFINLFSYFKIYIHNGYNVYSALVEIKNFASPNLKELLGNLIEGIDEDKSVQPFIKFARNFNDIIIEEMMISIYQMIDDGEQSNYLIQFESVFDKFAELQADKNLRAKDSSLGMLSSAPLVGSCFLIIMITIGIVGVLGDLMNVI